jgi:hypothetical protein
VETVVTPVQVTSLAAAKLATVTVDVQAITAGDSVGVVSLTPAGSGAGVRADHTPSDRKGDAAQKDLLLAEESLLAGVGTGPEKVKIPAGTVDLWELDGAGRRGDELVLAADAGHGPADKELFTFAAEGDRSSPAVWAGGWIDTGTETPFTAPLPEGTDFSGEGSVATGGQSGAGEGLAEYAAQDAAPLKAALANFLAQVENLCRELGAAVRGPGLVSSLAVFAVVGATLELTRRRRHATSRLGLSGSAGDLTLSWVTGLPARGSP